MFPARRGACETSPLKRERSDMRQLWQMLQTGTLWHVWRM
jgi:hypothetical protein